MQKKILKCMLPVVMGACLSMTAFASERLSTPDDPWWDGEDTALACWDEIDEAERYEVSLYFVDYDIDDEDDDYKLRKVTTIKTKADHYDFSRKIEKEGDYVVRLRALIDDSDEYDSSEWSEYSDMEYVSDSYIEYVTNGKQIDTVHSGPSALPNPTVQQQNVAAGKWILDQYGWWYQCTDGTYPKNGWFQDPADQSWYRFNQDGYMLTGWYLDQSDQTWYYLDQSGRMKTGWLQMGDVWYYLGEAGRMLANTTMVIDGSVCRFGADGAWLG